MVFHKYIGMDDVKFKYRLQYPSEVKKGYLYWVQEQENNIYFAPTDNPGDMILLSYVFDDSQISQWESKISGLEGKVIERMSKGVKVDYLETVSSQDKDESFAITTVELQFQRFWGARHIIPEGSKVQILRSARDNGEVRGRVFVDGKYYDKDFDLQYLRFPYVGQWKKVEFQGKPGFMKYEALSESKLM